MIELDHIKHAVARKNGQHIYTYFEIDALLKKKVADLDFEHYEAPPAIAASQGYQHTIKIVFSNETNPKVLVEESELVTLRKKLAQINEKIKPVISTVKLADKKYWVGHIVIYY